MYPCTLQNLPCESPFSKKIPNPALQLGLWSRSNTMHKVYCFQNATWNPLCDAVPVPALFTQIPTRTFLMGLLCYTRATNFYLLGEMMGGLFRFAQHVELIEELVNSLQYSTLQHSKIFFFNQEKIVLDKYAKSTIRSPLKSWTGISTEHRYTEACDTLSIDC